MDKDHKCTVLFVDYGNTDTVTAVRTAPLPAAYVSLPPQAREYRLACVQLPPDEEFCKDALDEFYNMIANKALLLNVEYKGTGECIYKPSNTIGSTSDPAGTLYNVLSLRFVVAS